jgi:hypothetical protein
VRLEGQVLTDDCLITVTITKDSAKTITCTKATTKYTSVRISAEKTSVQIQTGVPLLLILVAKDYCFKISYAILIFAFKNFPQRQWFLATQETEINKIRVRSSWQIVCETLSRKNPS